MAFRADDAFQNQAMTLQHKQKKSVLNPQRMRQWSSSGLWPQNFEQDSTVMNYPRHNGQEERGSLSPEINTMAEGNLNEINDFQTCLQITLKEACNESTKSCLQTSWLTQTHKRWILTVFIAISSLQWVYCMSTLRTSRPENVHIPSSPDGLWCCVSKGRHCYIVKRTWTSKP